MRYIENIILCSLLFYHFDSATKLHVHWDMWLWEHVSSKAHERFELSHAVSQEQSTEPRLIFQLLFLLISRVHRARDLAWYPPLQWTRASDNLYYLENFGNHWRILFRCKSSSFNHFIWNVSWPNRNYNNCVATRWKVHSCLLRKRSFFYWSL